MECGLSRRVHGLSRRVQHSPVVVLLNGVWSFEQDVTLSFVSFKCSLRFAESHCRTMSTVTDDESHTMSSLSLSWSGSCVRHGLPVFATLRTELILKFDLNFKGHFYVLYFRLLYLLDKSFFFFFFFRRYIPFKFEAQPPSTHTFFLSFLFSFSRTPPPVF